jgi:hypothetical protein
MEHIEKKKLEDLEKNLEKQFKIIRGKLKVLFCMNSGFERLLCVIRFWFCLLGFWISFRKKNRYNYKGNSENSDKFQKL